MSAPNSTTIVGNLAADPDIRTTSGEHALTRLRVAVNSRIRRGEEWEDRLDGFFTVVLWREAARNAAMSLQKGDRVVVIGRLRIRTFDAETGDGTPAQRRQIVEIDADEVACSLRFDRWGKQQTRPMADLDAIPGGRGTGDAAGSGGPDDGDGDDARVGVAASGAGDRRADGAAGTEGGGTAETAVAAAA